MDPFSAILLIGIMTVAGVKTAGSAVTDGIAQARGQTPPSLEKWRANQEKREKRGEAPRTDPGGLKRIWANNMDAAAKKSAYKHAGRMQYLDDHGEDIAEAKRRRLEAAARCRQIVGGKLASAGGSSWNALRTVAARRQRGETSPDALDDLEEEAWEENRRRDAERRDAEEDQGQHTGPDADVLPFAPRLAFLPREDGNTEVQPITADTANPDEHIDVRGDHNDPATWRGTDRYGRDIQTGRGHSHTDEHGNTVHDSDEYLLGEDVSPERRIVRAHQRTATASREETSDPEHDRVRDPDVPGDTVSVAELQRRRATQERARERAYESDQAQADREHAERLAQLQQTADTEQQQTSSTTDADITPDDSFGGDMTHSGEITDLPSALTYVQGASDYCEQVGGTLELTQAQANATVDEIEQQLGGLETAQSSLHRFELDSEADRLGQVHERFAEIVEAMRQLEEATTAAREALSSARATLDDSASEFESQTGITEQLNSHDSVANDTKFYTNA